MQTLLNSLSSSEKYAHIEIDDVLLKAVEELAEYEEALQSQNKEEQIKELSDILFNVVSAMHKLGLTIPKKIAPYPLSGHSLSELLGKFVQEAQNLRGRYTRKEGSMPLLKSASIRLISKLCFLLGISDIENTLAKNLEKFASRLDLYKPQIDLNAHISEIADFPKAGINFRDISPLLAHPQALSYAIDELALLVSTQVDAIVGLDARGFIFGSLLSAKLQKPFVMIRKKGKLPGPVIQEDYDLEYGSNTIEIGATALAPGSRVVLVDDLIATGGTLLAAAHLVEKV
jgi:adenine phosphoribosyltransferase